MKRCRELGIIAAVTLVAVAVYGYWNRESLFYTTDRFQGDGAMNLNRGHWPYPDWYSVQFRSIPLDKARAYRFRFRGVPPKEFSFHLRFPLSSDDLHDRYAELKTRLSVTLFDEGGTVLGACSSPINRGWHLAEVGPDGYFYHWSTYKLSLHSDRAYELRVTITDVDPRTPRIDAVPSLESTQG